MWIPPTIPELILRAYTRKLTPAEVEAQQKSGIIRSENANWDDDIPSVSKTLTSFCIKKIASSYVDLVGKVDERNKRFRQQYDLSRAAWKKAWKQYRGDRREYEELMEEHEQKSLRFSFELTDEYLFDHPDRSFDGSSNDDWEPPVEPEIPPSKPPPLARAKPILTYLTIIDRIHLMEAFDKDKLPIEIALRTIPDEHYWKPLAQKKFPDAIVEQYKNSWKRVYVEKSLREIIEFFHPYEGKWEDFEKEVNIFSPYAVGLELYHLIPICYGVPRKATTPDEFAADDEIVGPEDEGFLGSEYLKRKKMAEDEKKDKTHQQLEEEKVEAEFQKEARNDNSHVNLGLVLPKMKRLRYLSIMYKMQEAGLSYEPRFQEFTTHDCKNLAKGLKKCYQLRRFSLQRSRVTDEMTKILCHDGMRYFHHLKILNLSYNELGNAGGKAIAKLISDDRSAVHATLHTLILTSCQIKREGSKAIAFALTLNRHLRRLVLRLNPMYDTGGTAIANALMENKSLLFLDMSATNMGPRACTQLGKMLLHNETLREVNFSSNPNIGSTAAGVVAKAVHFNKKIFRLDFRCCKIDEGLEGTMALKSYNNVMNSGRFEWPSSFRKFKKREARYAKLVRYHHRKRKDKKGKGVNFVDETEEEDEEEHEAMSSPGQTAFPPLGVKSPTLEVPTSKEPPPAGQPQQPEVPEGEKAKVPATGDSGKSNVRRKLKPFEIEERRLRYLMKDHDENDRIYESWLKGDRLDKYIAFLEDKVAIKDKTFKRRHKRHRWVNKSLMGKVPKRYSLFY